MNSDYDGARGQTFELGVQFESNVAGEVTGVLFYKQSGMSGTNVGHLWSSNGTLLASATFTNETSSGWQQVSFSSPVAILANTIYTVSYDTGSPLFYYDSEYFAKGGVTNGNLTAPQSTTINGKVLDNGVYNYGGDSRSRVEYYANFWVDLVFLPGSGNAIPATVAPANHPAQPAAIVGVTPSQSCGLVISPPAATPAGPAFYGARSRGAVPTFLGPLPSPSQAESDPTGWGDRVFVQEVTPGGLNKRAEEERFCRLGVDTPVAGTKSDGIRSPGTARRKIPSPRLPWGHT